MVLADLGRRLNAALSSLNRAPVVDEKVGFLLVFDRKMGVKILTARRQRFWMQPSKKLLRRSLNRT